MVSSSSFGALLVAAASLAAPVISATFNPLQPPSYPLIVRNPYSSLWLPGLEVSDIAASQPQFWAGQNLTLGILALLDGKAYTLFGVPDGVPGTEKATLDTATYTSTRTTFNLTAGDNSIDLDFFSPVSPDNLVRHSLPFGYLTISTSAKDAIIYVDIDETWTGQSANTAASFTQQDNDFVWQLSAPDAAKFNETADMATWGSAVLAVRGESCFSQIGSLADTRSAFAKSNGDVNTTQGNYTHGDTVALIAKAGGSTSAQFVLGYARDPAINYLGNDRSHYYTATLKDTVSAVTYFLDDYEKASDEGTALDAQISSDATKVGGANYSDILGLSLRQTFASLDVTIPSDTKDTDNIMVFLKEISSDGNVNTLDVLFPAFPVWYVHAPNFIKWTLEPVLQYLKAGRWPNPYVIHDIGASYPNAIGHDDGDAEFMPYEETGNLLQLVLAYQKKTGDTDWAKQYDTLLQTYADYIADNALNIVDQLSTDDGAGSLPNQTHLAIKAAIGLNAFGVLSGQKNYSQAGLDLADKLYNQGVGTDEDKTRFTLQYDNKTTYTTTFNLYPDKLLELNTFPQAAFDMMSSFLPTKRAQTGVPLDPRTDWEKSDWAIFVASYSSDSTKKLFIDDVHGMISNNLPGNQVPFSDRWFVSDSMGNEPGTYNAFRARPVVGGHWALLALDG